MRPSGTKGNYNLRGDKILTLPKVNTSKYGLKSLRYEGANLWNTEKRTLTNCSRNRYQIRIWLVATCRNHMPIYFKTF